MFSCEYWEIFKNTYFEEYLQTVASAVKYFVVKYQRMKPNNTRRSPFNASTFYRCLSPKIHLYIKGGHTSQSTSVNTANVFLQENKGLIHNGIAVSGIWAKSLFQKIRVKRRVASASKVQMFNIAKNEIVCQCHYKIAKLTEGYRIPQTMISNSRQLPQITSPFGEQQYHPKTQSCHFCWLNRLASNYIQSTLTDKSCPSNDLGWENNAIIIKKVNFLRV